MTFRQWFWGLFGIREETDGHPFRERAPFVPGKNSQPLPEGYVNIAGKHYIRKEIEPGIFEDEIIKGPIGRDAKLSPEEERQVIARGLRPEIAAEVKHHWKDGLSTKAAELKHLAPNGKPVKGYGYRTLDKYWSIFNAFWTPPPVKKQARNETGPKSARNAGKTVVNNSFEWKL